MNKFIRLLKKRRNGGFTLIEMVVSIAALAILLGGMMLFISPVIQSFNDNSRNLVAENVSTCIQDYISLGTRNATNVLIIGNTNEQSIKTNANGAINALKTFCKTQTSEHKNAYTMNCISLKYNSTDKRYYLYKETVDVSQNGDFADPVVKDKDSEVFSKCFYDDLYFDVKIEKALDMDKADQTPQPTLNDTAKITINTYDDADNQHIVFSTSGMTEFREIGREITRKNSKAKYMFQILSGKSCTATDCFSSADAEDDARDIYIFYTSYNFAGGK